MIGAIPAVPLPPDSGAATARTESARRRETSPARDGDDRARGGFALALLAWLGQPARAVAALAKANGGEAAGAGASDPAANEDGTHGAAHTGGAGRIVPGGITFPELTAAAAGNAGVASDRPSSVSPKLPAVAAPLAPVVARETSSKPHPVAAPLAPVASGAPAGAAPVSPAWPELAPGADPAGPPSGAPVATTPAPSPARAPVAAPLAPAREEGGADPRERRGESGSALLRAARRTGRAAGPVPLEPATSTREATPVTPVKFAELTPPGSTPVRVPVPAAGFEAPSMRVWEARLAGRATPGDAVVMRLEDDAGGTGSLRLHVRGDSLLATLRTDDAALAGRLGRDLGELEQSLRERGIERTRIQVTGPPAGATVTNERREPGREETSPRRDERPTSRRDDDPRRNARSQERNPR